MEESVFTKIIKGDIPSHKVYEDEKTMAFLDIHPVLPGMTVVVPKVQVANFEDLDDGDYIALWETVKKVALKLRQIFPDALKIGVEVEGLEVAHAHVKLLPFSTVEDLKREADHEAEPDHESLSLLAERLRF